MVAPALVGVDVGPGVHTVKFSYGGYGSYTALFVLASWSSWRSPSGRRCGGVWLEAPSEAGPSTGLNTSTRKRGRRGLRNRCRPAPGSTRSAMPRARPQSIGAARAGGRRRRASSCPGPGSTSTRRSSSSTEDLEYMPTCLSRRCTAGTGSSGWPARSCGPDRMGFNAHLNHVATEGDVVLTDRVDELTFRRFATPLLGLRALRRARREDRRVARLVRLARRDDRQPARAGRAGLARRSTGGCRQTERAPRRRTSAPTADSPRRCRRSAAAAASGSWPALRLARRWRRRSHISSSVISSSRLRLQLVVD